MSKVTIQNALYKVLKELIILLKVYVLLNSYINRKQNIFLNYPLLEQDF